MTRGACTIAVLLACHAHDHAMREQHPCDPSGPRPLLAPSYGDYLSSELYPDELALRASCALPRGREVPDVTEQPSLSWNYSELVLRDSVPLDDAALAAQCETATSGHDATTRGACRRACLVDGRARAARVLFTRIVAALERSERSTSCTGTNAECLGLDFLPSRFQLVGASADHPAVRGMLIPGGPVYEFTLDAQYAGCGQSVVAPVVRLVDPFAPRKK